MTTDTITLRPIEEGDMEFLYRVYASTREEELSILDWDDAQKEAFLRMQFDAQHTYYQQEYSDAKYCVIMSGDQPIGRLYVDRRDEDIRVIDIALLSEHRGNGIGGTLMQEILDEAARQSKSVSIHVEKNNPALHLYNRLGFRPIGDAHVYWLMEWTADIS